jgi:HD-like signal output (HDOD) protein
MNESTDTIQAIDAFLARHPTVQALPENTSRVLRLTSDPDCNLKELLKLISQDTALAAAIMRAINSAHYAMPTKITRLDQAVTLMGLRTVKEISLSACMSNLCKPVKLGRYDGRALWDHTIAVAIMARELAVHSHLLDPEEAFLAGLLHDIALLLSMQSEVAMATALIGAVDAGHEAFIAQEQRVFGFNHCQLGHRLASAWNFAPPIAAVIGCHHEPERSGQSEKALVKHVHVADTLCCQAMVGFPLTCNTQQVSDDMLAELKITRERANEVTAKLPLLIRLHVG